jgi:sporulation protein YlmC with PRC-barrel domain
MLVKCQTLGAALLAAASLGTLFSAGCAAKPPASASAPTSAIAEHQAAPEAASNRLQREPANSSDAVRLGLISKTTALIGRKVLTRQENSLGRVDDLVLDLSTGQAVAVLVSAGPDEHLTPVPARSFWTASRNKILVSTDQKTFESAPHFPKADSMLALEAGRLAESFRHFGQKAPEPPAPGSDGYCSAAGLAALRLVSQTKEPLGQVAEIMVDVPVGRIAYLVIQPAVGIGSSNDLYVVPPQSVRADAAGRSLVLNADPAYFLAGPYFQRDFPAEMSRPEVTAAMLLHYNVQPGLPGEADPTHQQVRARIETPGAPADAPAARSDQEITAAIVTEFVRNSGAFPTRDFKIITTQGHVTLSGHVGSESKKQQLGAAAARVVGAENVDNQLNHPPGRGS